MALTYEPLATTTLGSASNTITFSSISGTYTDLRIILTGTSSVAGVDFVLRFNSDTATNYSLTYLAGNGSTASAGSSTSATGIIPSTLQTLNTTPQMFTFDIFNYAGSTFKTCLFNANQDLNGSGIVLNGVSMWRSTSAITTVGFTGLGGNFATGSTATLYGITKA